MKVSHLFVSCLTVALSIEMQARPVWRDPEREGKCTVTRELSDGSRLRVDAVSDDIFRVRRTKHSCWTESGMNRYGIIKRLVPTGGVENVSRGICAKGYAVELEENGAVLLKSRVSFGVMRIGTELTQKGGKAMFPLARNERLYGLGDVDRGTLQRRGGRYEIWVKSINSYIPIPMILARRGWGVFLNTTWRSYFDVGKTDPDVMRCEVPEGDLDFYVFVGKDYRALLDAYTRLTGRPQLLPSFAFGFAYVCNQHIDQFELMNEATWFKKFDLPVDIMGLEPGWMDTFYDHSTAKKWNKQKFNSFPFWAPTGDHTFPAALKRMGINLSLWMCTDYDFYLYEEQCAAGRAKQRGEPMKIVEGVPETWEDPRIGAAGTSVQTQKEERERPTACFEWDKYQDMNIIDKKYIEEAKYPEGALPWFRHLEKFVDQGVRCWKLDGNLQVCQDVWHPDRIFTNGMNIAEGHNLYPLVYCKQMARGYEDYTGHRAMVYSSGGYAGIQSFVATWAGDTGGGCRTLVSTLNLGMSGHPNQSCDMVLYEKESVHYGFLAPWSQANDWDSFYRPWTVGDEAEARIRHYAKLRYSLFPYLYTAAAEAAQTGYPIARPLVFVYPDEPRYDQCHTTYLLGSDLLVSAFTNVIEVPPGVWYDWEMNRRVVGPCCETVNTNGVWGGGLFVKEGAIIPRWNDAMRLPKGWRKDVTFDVWPLENDGVTTRIWYEDDGESLKYREGEYTQTEVSCETRGDEFIFRLASRKGAFDGMPSSHHVTVRIHCTSQPAQTVDLGEVDAGKGFEHRIIKSIRVTLL